MITTFFRSVLVHLFALERACFFYFFLQLSHFLGSVQLKLVDEPFGSSEVKELRVLTKLYRGDRIPNFGFHFALHYQLKFASVYFELIFAS